MRWHKTAYRQPQLPHEVLGVSATATPAEIRAAYRRLLRVYHPDKAHPFMQQSNERMAKTIIAAYATLTDRQPARPIS